MSCVHYQSNDPPRDRIYYDGQYNRYSSPSYSPGARAPDTYRYGYYTGWKTPEFQGNDTDPSTPARGNPTFTDARMQSGRITPTCRQEAMKQADTMVLDKLQARLKYLEDSNTVIQTRNHNLITENKALTSQLEEERNEVKRLEKRVVSLREELDLEASKLEAWSKEAEERRRRSVSANGTSTTSIVSRADRGVQVWAVCMGCQRKLESCGKQPSTVTITKSELEVLENDMQALRDTIIAREEAWDKAMEREQNYRQQLTRLTTETITARHLSETRYEELQTIANVLTEKESEMKSLQKDNLYLNKLIAKLYNSHQRGQGESQKNNMQADMNEKDQRFIEEVVRRVSSAKGKQKPKARSACSERTTASGAYQNSPRERSSKKDQAGSSRESKR